MGNRIKKLVSVYLDPDVYLDLEKLCLKYGVGKSKLIEDEIKSLIAREGDLDFVPKTPNYKLQIKRGISLDLHTDPKNTLEEIAKEIRDEMKGRYNLVLSKATSMAYARQVKNQFKTVTFTLSPKKED